MALVEKEVIVSNKFGLHARPAMRFVEMANKYSCTVKVSKGDLTVDAKSIMGVMRLAATQNTVLKIIADGEDSEEAADSLVSLVESGFTENS